MGLLVKQFKLHLLHNKVILKFDVLEYLYIKRDEKKSQYLLIKNYFSTNIQLNFQQVNHKNLTKIGLLYDFS